MTNENVAMATQFGKVKAYNNKKEITEAPMINLNNLDRQHGLIATEVRLIETEVKKDTAFIDTAEAALHISRLGGLLKIHLLEEDQYLYPGLLHIADHKIQLLAEQYIDEMGDLANAYTEYKNNYNVAGKIKRNPDAFVKDSIKIIEALKKRITKEEKELYKLIRERNL
jgi:hypothetical protein